MLYVYVFTVFKMDVLIGNSIQTPNSAMFSGENGKSLWSILLVLYLLLLLFIHSLAEIIEQSLDMYRVSLFFSLKPPRKYLKRQIS